jgi:hypothetical protein
VEPPDLHVRTHGRCSVRADLQVACQPDPITSCTYGILASRAHMQPVDRSVYPHRTNNSANNVGIITSSRYPEIASLALSSYQMQG